MDLYPWLVWLNLIHVIAVMAFILVHGVSGLMALRIRAERDRDRIRLMVQLSSSFLVWGWIALAVLFFGGILSGIAGGWWTSGKFWIWASLIVFVAVTVLMTPLASSYMDSVRHAVGLPSVQDQRKKRAAPEPVSDEELAVVLGSSKPITAAFVGVGGIVILTWLMMVKPF